MQPKLSRAAHLDRGWILSEKGAGEQDQQLDHGWIGSEHFLVWPSCSPKRGLRRARRRRRHLRTCSGVI